MLNLQGFGGREQGVAWSLSSFATLYPTTSLPPWDEFLVACSPPPSSTALIHSHSLVTAWPHTKGPAPRQLPPSQGQQLNCTSKGRYGCCSHQMSPARAWTLAQRRMVVSAWVLFAAPGFQCHSFDSSRGTLSLTPNSSKESILVQRLQSLHGLTVAGPQKEEMDFSALSHSICHSGCWQEWNLGFSL